jgi:hypothetical protein
MWPRWIEIALALWLAMSPLVFPVETATVRHWAHDLAVAAAVLASSLMSFKPALGKLHVLNVVLGAWLVGVGYLASGWPSAVAQNHVAVGLLLIMVAILPNRSTLPPQAWREFENVG